ncbi:hypothetical protein PR048_015793 [Dryococelus australis]|uniref:Uncharacterized protein n=1 Tax=Dryococelus australis TaxID=614101 RepID=A0ABQ9HHX6_9NEOP|nr:hypothetical protein PR048_015793 [Dryococelus australis]
MTQDPNKKVFYQLKILDSKSIILAHVSPGLVANIKNLPASENNSVDIVKALNVVRMSRPSFETKDLEAIWSLCANVDYERFLSSCNTVLSDRRTTLKESRLAAMAIFAFEDLC